MRENENQTVRRFLGGKGFYAVLAVCLLAIGGAAWSVTQILSPAVPGVVESSDVPQVSSTQSTAQADNPVLDVPDPRTSSSQIESEPSTVVTTAPVAASFVMPVTGDILKEFSLTQLQYSETYLDMRLHQGIDVLCDKGTKIKSAGDGVVKNVETDALWGVRVVIDHGNGIVATYAGLNKKPAVKAGDTVKGGTVIGELDVIPCESVEAPHLHFEVTQNGAYISPLSLFGTE